LEGKRLCDRSPPKSWGKLCRKKGKGEDAEGRPVDGGFERTKFPTVKKAGEGKKSVRTKGGLEGFQTRKLVSGPRGAGGRNPTVKRDLKGTSKMRGFPGGGAWPSHLGSGGLKGKKGYCFFEVRPTLNRGTVEGQEKRFSTSILGLYPIQRGDHD